MAFAFFAVYLLYALVVLMMPMTQVEYALEGNNTPIRQAISLGDTQSLKLIFRSLVANGLCKTIRAENASGIVIDSYPSHLSSKSQFSGFHILENNLLYSGRYEVIHNGNLIAYVFYDTKIQVNQLVIGLFILGLLYFFAERALRGEFSKIGKIISGPLLNFHRFLNGESALGQSSDMDADYLEINDITAEHRNLMERLKAAQKAEIESRTYRAIALTTQMLAHDVKKPFNLLKMGTKMLKAAENKKEVDDVLETLLPTLDQAQLSVNGLIEDVMEISRKVKPQFESIDISALISQALLEVFASHNDKNVELAYCFNHRHLILGDYKKLSRVFSNILSNAAEAMTDETPKIWIDTEEISENNCSYIKLCIGNTGSYIDEQSIESIFDTFFSSGKPQGTGLGLAIAKKIILAHGGKIWCTSDRSRGVEFHFTLKKSEQMSISAATLPGNSSAIFQNS